MSASTSIEAEAEAGAPAGLKQKALKSAVWTFVRIGTDQFFNFLLFAILARLLGPAAFGLFALAFVFTELGKTVISAGLVDAVIREPEVTPELIDTVFWANLAVSIAVGTISIVLAGPVARLLGEPQLEPLIQILALVPLIVASGATHMALRLREFGHRTVAVRALVSGIIGGGVAVAAAMNGWGVWAFVVQRFVTEIATTLLAWRAYRWFPGRQFSLRRLRSIFSFSANMMLTQILFLLLVRVQDLIIGYRAGAAAVGVYRTAWKTVEVISQATIVPFSFVSLPTLARLQHDRTAYEKTYRRLVLAGSLFSFPAIIGFGVLAGDLIPLLYGPQWGQSVPVAHVLAAMVAPFALGYFATPTLAAGGHSGTVFKNAMLQLCVTLILSWFAAPMGVTAVAAAYVLRAYITTPIQLWALQKHMAISIWGTLKDIAAPFAAALVMAASLMLLGEPVRHHLRPLPATAVLVGLGALVYAAACLAIGGRDMRAQISSLRSMMTRKITA